MQVQPNETKNLDHIKDTASWLALQGLSYKVLSSVGVANGQQLYYVHDWGTYYLKGKKKASEEDLAKFLPYLRWKYSELVDETAPVKKLEKRPVKTKAKKGEASEDKELFEEVEVEIQLKTGRKIDKFPPTEENIAAKRIEIDEALNVKGAFNEPQERRRLFLEASPRLKSHETFDKLEEQQNASQAERYKQMFLNGLL